MALSNRLKWGAIGGCGLAGLIALSDPITAQQAQPGAAAPAAKAAALAPAVVGSIDMDAIFKGYEKVKVSSESFKAAASAKQEELVKLAADIKAEIEKLNKLKPDMPDYKKQETLITEMRAKHEAGRQSAEREFARLEAVSLGELYQEIVTMASRVAKHKGMGYVVKVSTDAVDGQDPNSVMAAMSRAVIYSDKRYDITRDVLYYLNQEYQQKTGSGAAATPAQAEVK